MKISNLAHPNQFVRKMIALPLAVTGLLLFASILFAKGVEPGPEADGVWVCDKVVITEKEITYVELGTLELRGRTYRTASKGKSFDGVEGFIPFTTDAAGEIKWSNSFAFVSYMGAIHKSTYYKTGDKPPTIEIDYSDNHSAGRMTCTKKE